MTNTLRAMILTDPFSFHIKSTVAIQCEDVGPWTHIMVALIIRAVLHHQNDKKIQVNNAKHETHTVHQ